MSLRLRPRRVLTVVLSVAFVALLSACQMNVKVDTVVNDDGSGTVTVAVGLDDKALTHLGNPDTEVQVDDLKATGWKVDPAAKGADGFTWLRATKSFANPNELNAILQQLTLGRGAFHDFKLSKDESLTSTTWTFTGTVDLTKGLEQFGDADLAGALNGDPLGGIVPVIEKEEGKPATQMIALDMTVKLPNADAKDFKPTFADPAPTQINAQAVQAKPVVPLPTDGESWLLLVVVAAALVGAVVVLFVLRARFASR
jgi:hypothetical protein